MLTGPITAESGTKLIQELEAAQTAASIILEINSPGGSVDPGFLLAKAIEASPVPVACVVDGEADSMAMYLLQSCPIRAMTRRSVLMTHQPSVGGLIQGDQRTYRDLATMLEALTKAIGAQVCHRFLDPGACRARMLSGDEWWLSADDALQVGAVDVLVGP